MKIRMKFSKNGPLKFVGHLDIMRYFQKVFRRSSVDIAYSKGYSPHQILSFAAPLGLGVTSDGEYLDAEFHSSESSADMLRIINEQMNEGIELLEFKLLPDKCKNAMSSVAGADYRITFREGYYDETLFLDNVSEFISQESIFIIKKTKKSEKEVDIRPMIYEMDVVDGHIFMKLATGSVNNLKPNLVMEAFCRYLGVEHHKFAFQIHRLETYLDNDGNLMPLGSAGEEIIAPIKEKED
ncbi:MAG: TIGR03936 family radical SAM-associated protein [Lachnospiraceae bacterium]|nr:TIGR03936 family radical SAM-associated protein [Lachnospiraceae bacterium]